VFSLSATFLVDIRAGSGRGLTPYAN